MDADEFVIQARIDVQTLEAWLEAGWLNPRRHEARRHYSEIDVARAHLISDLNEMGINEAGMPIILDLVDQLHGLRRVLSEVLSAARSGQQQGR